MDVVNRARIS